MIANSFSAASSAFEGLLPPLLEPLAPDLLLDFLDEPELPENIFLFFEPFDEAEPAIKSLR
jgi:hypothetical protein